HIATVGIHDQATFRIWTERVGLVPGLLGYGRDERPGSDEVLGGLSEGVARRQDHSQKQSHRGESELADPLLHSSSPFDWGVEEIKRLHAITAVADLPRSKSLPLPKLRIPGVAQRVAEQVEPEHGEADRQTREDRQPRRLLHEGASRAGEHEPPRWRGRLRADAEE